MKIIPIDLSISISKVYDFEVKDNVTDYEDAFKNSETFKHLKNVLKGAGFIIDDWNISYETN